MLHILVTLICLALSASNTFASTLNTTAERFARVTPSEHEAAMADTVSATLALGILPVVVAASR